MRCDFCGRDHMGPESADRECDLSNLPEDHPLRVADRAVAIQEARERAREEAYEAMRAALWEHCMKWLRALALAEQADA